MILLKKCKLKVAICKILKVQPKVGSEIKTFVLRLNSKGGSSSEVWRKFI